MYVVRYGLSVSSSSDEVSGTEIVDLSSKTSSPELVEFVDLSSVSLSAELR